LLRGHLLPTRSADADTDDGGSGDAAIVGS